MLLERDFGQFNVARLSKGTAYLLSDFGPARCGLDAVTETIPKPMGLHRFTFFSTRLFMAPSFSFSAEKAGELACSYSARQVLPTLAELLRFSDHELLSVGDWQGVASNMPSLTTTSQDIPMPLRYSATKLDTSAAVKLELFRW